MEKIKFLTDPEYVVLENVWIFDGLKIKKVDWIAISQSFGTMFPYLNIISYSQKPENEAIEELKKEAGAYFNRNVEFYKQLLVNYQKQWKEFDESPMA